MEDQKPWLGFSRNHDFAEERGLEPQVKMSESEDAFTKLAYLKCITDGGLRAKPPAAGRLYLLKKYPSYLMPLNHI